MLQRLNGNVYDVTGEILYANRGQDKVYEVHFLQLFDKYLEMTHLDVKDVFNNITCGCRQLNHRVGQIASKQKYFDRIV